MVRALKRRLGECASPEGLIASFRTRALAEPVLQDTETMLTLERACQCTNAERNPDTVRGPDIAFIRSERLPQPIPSTFLEFAPDLAVEILSPHDRPGEVLAKVGDWLDAGARLVWVVDPEHRVARVYRQDGTEDVISGDGSLLGEDVLPRFSCTLAALGLSDTQAH